MVDDIKLTCISRDNVERECSLRVEETDGYPWFKVSHESVSNEFFEFILKPLNDRSHMVMMINAHGVFRGWGIPDAILPFAASYLSTEIHSSPTMTPESWRTPAATKVWERLVSVGKAEYNKATDTFRIIQ
ncbi:hypothetical protein [Achromobacter mucicolens]|jgi:hypothetical protein|uniref:hypothetical protein n=1 Tax=Achromobacter mucicolens TaxID=1389922 RepID=UPI00242AFA1E|nr:hypothetical protein [Achromobacter mucicolens]